MKPEQLSIRPSELIIIAGRPGTGKTTFAINLFSNWSGMPRLYCSLEMTSENMKQKIRQCYDPSFNSSFKNAKLCDDPFKINLPWLEEQIKTGKYQLIIIDHIQIFDAPIATLTRDLKQLCLKYNVAIIALSQLNRQGADAEPETWMLRGSGTIEQDADQIWFIKKHALKIAKNRNGECGEIGMEHDFSTGKFWFEDVQEKMYALCDRIIDRVIRDDKYYLYGNWEAEIDKVRDFDFNLWVIANKIINHKRQIKRMENSIRSRRSGWSGKDTSFDGPIKFIYAKMI